jgi:hypothetical protein
MKLLTKYFGSKRQSALSFLLPVVLVLMILVSIGGSGNL